LKMAVTQNVLLPSFYSENCKELSRKTKQ